MDLVGEYCMKKRGINPFLLEASRQVNKSNELIQRSRFNLSLQEQKIILYLISHITPFDQEFKLYEFNILDFCKVCGIDPDGGKNYRDIKAAIKTIADQSVWVQLDEDEETLLRWIEKPYINKNSGTIKIRLDEDMKPYLLNLRKNFTSYELIFTLRFKSKYTIRLYELIKSIHYRQLEEYERIFPLDELKRIMGAETYKTYQTFKTRALKMAVNEINEYSDIALQYIPLKKGKAVQAIKFIIKPKDTDEVLTLRAETEEAFGWTQLSLWDEET